MHSIVTVSSLPVLAAGECIPASRYPPEEWWRVRCGRVRVRMMSGVRSEVREESENGEWGKE